LEIRLVKPSLEITSEIGNEHEEATHSYDKGRFHKI